MGPIAVSLIALAVILAGALFGSLLRKALPDHHLADDTRDYVRLGTGLIATIAALVLGLLIASANSSYDTESSQVRHLTANIVLLDRLLDQYGKETRDARDLLRRAIEPLVERMARGQLGVHEGNAVPGDRRGRGRFRKNSGVVAKNRCAALAQESGNTGRYRRDTNSPTPV